MALRILLLCQCPLALLAANANKLQAEDPTTTRRYDSVVGLIAVPVRHAHPEARLSGTRYSRAVNASARLMHTPSFLSAVSRGSVPWHTGSANRPCPFSLSPFLEVRQSSGCCSWHRAWQLASEYAAERPTEKALLRHHSEATSARHFHVSLSGASYIPSMMESCLQNATRLVLNALVLPQEGHQAQVQAANFHASVFLASRSLSRTWLLWLP